MALPRRASRTAAPALPSRRRRRLVTDDARRHALAGRRAGGARGPARHAGRAARPAAACQRAQPLGPAAPRLCPAPDRRACANMRRQLAATAGPAAARIFVIPKAELHCHLEGSIPPALARELAARNGLDAAAPACSARDGHYVWKDFLSFLDAYDRVCSVLRMPRDFGDVLYSYLAGAARRGRGLCRDVLLARAARGAGHPLRRLARARWSAASTARGATSASRAASSSSASAISGPTGRWPWRSRMVAEPHPYVVGFGMGGDEAKFTPADFAPAYRLAHDKGFGCTVHAGEVRGAGERVGRDPRPAGHPHRPRRALDRGSAADGRAGAARHRPGGLPRQQHGARPLSRIARPIRCTA